MNRNINREAGTANVSLSPYFLFAVRLALAAIWAYEGLWQKVIVRDAHELHIVQAFAATPAGAHQLLLLIGLGETLLAIGILSGTLNRFVSWFQFALLLVMNLVGIFYGKGSIADPVGLLVHNLVLFACMALVALYGPGAFALKMRGRPNAA